MKKFAVGIAIMSVLYACKKESAVSETENTDSIAAVEEAAPAAPAIPFKKVELSPAETTEFLAKKNNDTLYVNNFFATWCGPCVREIPHFTDQMEALKDQPVKFTFISLDKKEDWDTTVKNFAEEHGIAGHVVLLDGAQLSPDFFPANFKQWDGGAIPFTFMRKGDKTDETLGMMSADMLQQKINSLK